MPGFAPYQLPTFRDPGGFDFSGLNSGLDELGKSIQRNKLLNEAKQIGEALNSGSMTNANGSTTPHPQVNQLLQTAYPDMSPAQGAAGAAGRDYPTAAQVPGMAQYSRAISNNESGGNYAEVGPATRTGDRAYGKYQVMGSNVGPWTQQVLGKTMTPQEFVSDPKAQEAVFNAKFGDYVKKYGPDGASRAWFAGEGGMNDPGRRDQLGTSVAGYAAKFNAGLGGQPTATPVSAPTAAPAQAGGLNYAAGIQKALSQGNIALATQLIQAQRSGEAAGRESQLFPYQLAEAQTGLQAKRDALEQAATVRAGTIANTIQNAPPEQQQAMWQRLIQSHPEMANTLQQYGVDPSNVKGGTDFFVKQAQGLGANTAQFTTVGHDQFGNPTYGWVNPKTQSVTPVQGAGNEAAAPAAQNVNGDAFLQTLPKPIADQVKAYADGRLAFPSGFALKTPYFQRMLQYVAQYDPNFDAVNYNSRTKTRNDFTSGKSAQNITSFNTAIGHLDTLDKSIDDLHNSNYPYWNKLSNTTARNTGDTRFQNAEKNFNAAKQAVVDELTRAFRGSGGNVHDIKGWEETINNADAPGALHTAVKRAIELLKSRIDSVGDQYNRGMGTTADPIRLLSPSAQRAIQRLSGDDSVKPEAAAVAPTASPSLQPGRIEDGYRFKGGDPADQNNWEKV